MQRGYELHEHLSSCIDQHHTSQCWLQFHHRMSPGCQHCCHGGCHHVIMCCSACLMIPGLLLWLFREETLKMVTALVASPFMGTPSLMRTCPSASAAGCWQWQMQVCERHVCVYICVYVYVSVYTCTVFTCKPCREDSNRKLWQGGR